MNARYILPPVAALIAVSIWIGIQRRSMASVERETVVLREAIASARDSVQSSAGPSASIPERGEKPVDEKEPIDWKELADQMAEMQSGRGSGNMRTMMRLQQRLSEMDGKELSAALEEIATLDLSAEARKMLEHALIGMLAQKSPQEALTRFADRLHDREGGLVWQLSSAMRIWAKEDPAAAIAWFDREIANGTFDSKSLDGKSRARLQFEAALVSDLVESDPDGARERVAALPADQRQELLQQMSNGQERVDPAKYANLVRTSLDDENQVSATFASAATRHVHQGGYEGVEKFMDEAGLSPAERVAAVEQAAGAKIQQISHQKKVPREEIENMREWAGQHAPGSQDKLTGRALAESAQQGNRNPFSDNAAIALEYHRGSGNDEVLGAFLDSHAARSNREQARGLIEHISDPELREKLSEQLK